METSMESELYEFWKKSFDSYKMEENGLVPFDKIDSLIRMIGYNPTEEEVEEMKNELSDCEGMDFGSFLYIAYHHTRYAHPIEDLKRAFELFDTEGTGKLSYGTVRGILGSVNKPFTDEEIDKTIEYAGYDDGQIDYDNLAKVLLNY